MNNIRNRKYARSVKKPCKSPQTSSNPELAITSAAALGILAGTFLIGLASGKILGLRKKWNAC